MTLILQNRHLYFFGKPAGMSRRDAETLARDNGAVVVSALGRGVDLIVVGEANPLGKDWLHLTDSLDEATRDAFETGNLEILTETEFWQRIGLDAVTTPSRPLYTPAMLSELTQIPTTAIRNWLRRGFLIPVRQIGKLPYFDFQAVLAAQQLKTLCGAGCSPDALSKIMIRLETLFPDCDRILSHLTLAPDHKTVLFRQNGELFDAGGQRFFDFSEEETGGPSLDDSAETAKKAEEKKICGEKTDWNDENVRKDFLTGMRLDSLFTSGGKSGENNLDTPPSMDLSDRDRQAFESVIGERIVALCESAQERESAGKLDEAVNCYRTALAFGGADADVSFQLAELLLQMNRPDAAKERYFMVLEMEEDHLEARVGLGRALTLLKENEEAVSVFRGALAIHPDYLEVRFLLGEILFRLHQWAESEEHLRYFRSADPDSPQIDRVDNMLREIRLGQAGI